MLLRGWIQNDRILHKYPPTNITIRCSQRDSSNRKENHLEIFPPPERNSFYCTETATFVLKNVAPRWENIFLENLSSQQLNFISMNIQHKETPKKHRMQL
ncbi:hypothetical protein CEXT_287821 [Caerostris extrusa]|uniref:Uncharacterized protein n=1 Tax=Caerostris extrusa TaxID=172846 RepID=A0AAV4MUE2_CAEEX|nr:hypothetical protein CEXT_287821 [Caerostris extrusa]